MLKWRTKHSKFGLGVFWFASLQDIYSGGPDIKKAYEGG